MATRSFPQHATTAPRPAALAGLLVALCVSLSACATSGSDGTEAAGPASSAPPIESTSTSTTSTVAPTTTTTVPPPPVHRSGDGGLEILALEERLVALGFRPGDADGVYTAQTASAVMAYQKYEGLGRDGAAGPETMSRIFTDPQGAGPSTSGGAPRIEIDLDRQIMFVTTPDGLTAIVNISSGNGQPYRHPAGYSAVATTPVGSYAVGRKIDGPEVAPLGTLYRPMYFKGGFAVHGSTSVPGYPASHGCVRTSYVDQDWLYPQMPAGTPVVLYSGGPVVDAGTDNPAA